MEIKDRVIGKMAQQMAPGLTKVLESLHAHLEAQLEIQKEILILIKMEANSIEYDEAKAEIDKIIQKIINSN